MTTGHDLAARLTSILEHDLGAVQRLNSDETWVGPTADSTQSEFKALNHRLLGLIDEILRFDQLAIP